MNRSTIPFPSDEFKNIEEILQRIFGNPKLLFGGAAVIAILIGLWTSFYEVQPDEQAVVTRFGKFVETRGPGLNFKLPFGIEQVHKVSTRVEQETFGFRAGGVVAAQPDMFGASRMSALSSSPAEESLMLTGDLNVAEVQWVVQYQIADARKFLFNVAHQQKNIRDISMAAMRRVVGNRSVFDVLTVGRQKLAAEAREITQETLDRYDMGVVIRDFNLQRVTPPEPVRPSFNDVSAAIQNKNEIITLANAEYDRMIPEARGRAEREILEAEGYKIEVLNRAKGDSQRLTQILAEYKRAPEATKSRLYLDLMEQTLGRIEGVTIVDPELRGILPVLPGPITAGQAAAAAAGGERASPSLSALQSAGPRN